MRGVVEHGMSKSASGVKDIFCEVMKKMVNVQ
jgi:hypothetical protein